MRYRLFALALALTIAADLMAPSAMPVRAAAPAATVVNAHPAFLDKTRFLLHAGAAYFAFHHWVYAPYKKGAFAAGAPKRTRTIVKAGIAVLFTYHELKVAYGIAQKSNSKLLHALTSPLTRLLAVASAVGARLKGGHYSTGDINQLNTQVKSFGSAAQHNGYTITDKAVPVPGV